MSKVVVVEYTLNEVFKIPKNINLKDKSVVEYWYVKCNILRIGLVDGTELEIEPEGWINNTEYMNPNEQTIQNAKDWGIDEEDDE